VAGCGPAKAATYKSAWCCPSPGPNSSLVFRSGYRPDDPGPSQQSWRYPGPDGKKYNLEIIVEDDASDASKATLAAKKLVEQDNVAVLIGSSGSAPSMAMIDIATQDETPMISLAASSTIVNPIADRKWISRLPRIARGG